MSSTLQYKICPGSNSSIGLIELLEYYNKKNSYKFSIGLKVSTSIQFIFLHSWPFKVF